MKATGTRPRLIVGTDGSGVIGHGVARLLTDLADVTGLSGAFNEALAPMRRCSLGHDPGRVAVDLAATWLCCVTRPSCSARSPRTRVASPCRGRRRRLGPVAGSSRGSAGVGVGALDRGRRRFVDLCRCRSTDSRIAARPGRLDRALPFAEAAGGQDVEEDVRLPPVVLLPGRHR